MKILNNILSLMMLGNNTAREAYTALDRMHVHDETIETLETTNMILDLLEEDPEIVPDAQDAPAPKQQETIPQPTQAPTAVPTARPTSQPTALPTQLQVEPVAPVEVVPPVRGRLAG